MSVHPHLLAAQAFIPPSERVEAAGFSFPGDSEAIRNEVLRRLSLINEYKKLFRQCQAEARH